jgi:23S rRNA pseudouridine2605 synthase
MKMHPEDRPESEDAEPALVRLNKFLADHGVASRRRCDELIAAGKVTIDGEIVTALGTKVDPLRERVEIDGVVLSADATRHRYYLLNKPRGVVCTNERREARPRAIDLITDPDKGRIYTVGRLDEESQGLILLTNDGDFAQRVAHPRHGVTKTYLAKVSGRIGGDALKKLREGVHLAEGRTGPAYAKVLKRARDFSVLAITLAEGKNREVRRILAAVGHEVRDLRRTHIGPLSDRSLKAGEWRPLLRAEVSELLAQSRPATGAEGLSDRRKDPRARHFAQRAPEGPGPERRRPGSKGYERDKRRARGYGDTHGRRHRGGRRGPRDGRRGERGGP